MDSLSLSIEEQRAIDKLVLVLKKLNNKEFPQAPLHKVIEIYTECLNEAIDETKKKRK